MLIFNTILFLQGEVIERSVSCNNNKLTTLKGIQKEIFGSLYCRDNKIKTFKGRPEKINGNFFIENNRLISLEHRPKKILGSFVATGNKITNVKNQVIKYGIEAEKYVFDEIIFEYKDIKEEFENYQKKKEETLNELKNQKDKYNKSDFGFGI